MYPHSEFDNITYNNVTPLQVAEVVGAWGEDGCSLLTAAAEGGNEAVFMEVVGLMIGRVSRRGFSRVIGPVP